MNFHYKFQITCQGNAKSHGNPRKLATPRRFGSDRPITNGFFFFFLLDLPGHLVFRDF